MGAGRVTVEAGGRDAFLEEWRRKGFPAFKPSPIVWREDADGRGNITLRREECPRGYLTVGEIAEWAGVCRQAMHQREAAGEFDCGPFAVARIGSAVRIPVETFARWAEGYLEKRKGGEAGKKGGGK